EATTPELVAQCLYQRLGQGNQSSAVAQALEKLRNLNLLSYSEKTGYKIQSSAGQEWARERERYTVTPDAMSEIVAGNLKTLLGTADNPKYRGNKFRWAAYYSDGRQRQDEKVQVPSELAVVTVDFRYLRNQADRQAEQWIKTSANSQRIFWVVGKNDALDGQVRELARSFHMLNKYDSRRATLSEGKKRLLGDEQTRYENLEERVKAAVIEAFLAGALYFRGRKIDKQAYGSGFASVLTRLAEGLMPDLYSRYVDVAVTPTELAQLLDRELSGASHKFMPEGLGILELDAGKYAPTCQGEVPRRVEQYVLDEKGIAGTALLTHFGGPPYGYPADMVKACLAGLLRASKIRVRTDSGTEVTSVQDPGARDLFTKDREIKRADILPPSNDGITGRDRIAICKFFEQSLAIPLDRDNDTIADAVFKHFPNQARRLREVAQRYNRLPGRPSLPESLEALQKALESCMRSRQVEPTLLEVRRCLDELGDGIEDLGILLTDLNDDAVASVARAVDLQTNQIAQMRQIGRLGTAEAAVEAIKAQLSIERPWRDIASLEPQLKTVEEQYQAVRLDLIQQQEQQFELLRGQLQQRQGYYNLAEAQEEKVLRPLRDAVSNTTKEALYPTLIELKDPAHARLYEAAEKADRYLDDALAEETGVQVIECNVTALLSKKEISSVAELDALIAQMREGVVNKLEEGSDIRIRLI
ncbi:MAG: BREX system P-loop protein BrxC, partial [Cyanobacteria bacterium J06555_13]